MAKECYHFKDKDKKKASEYKGRKIIIRIIIAKM